MSIDDPERLNPSDGLEADTEREFPAGELPPFEDPANRQHHEPPLQEQPRGEEGVLARRNEQQAQRAPKDTQYAGHPDFSQEAANNKPPRGIGNSLPVDDVDEETRHSDGVNSTLPSDRQPSAVGAPMAFVAKDI